MLSGREIRSAATTTRVVLVARQSRWPDVDSVANDDRAGARIAVEHLFELGHCLIGHIDGGKGAGATARRAGYRDAMRRYGVDDDSLLVRGAYTEEGGAAGVAQLLEGGTCPTAIFAANDLAAVGALHALEKQGLRVPDDVSLIGYDNTSLAALGHINLTTIDQPRREMGATAVRLLLRRLDQRRVRARHILVEPKLVVRGTTGPPR